jgi:hypothetical protein
MKCWHCDSDAKAVCMFCGRAVCVAHRKTKEHHAGFGKKNKSAVLEGFFSATTKVSDATWCGVCEVV